MLYFKLGEIVTGLNADRSLPVESEKKKKKTMVLERGEELLESSPSGGNAGWEQRKEWLYTGVLNANLQ